jgi:hypothetical protein
VRGKLVVYKHVHVISLSHMLCFKCYQSAGTSVFCRYIKCTFPTDTHVPLVLVMQLFWSFSCEGCAVSRSVREDMAAEISIAFQNEKCGNFRDATWVAMLLVCNDCYSL